MPPSRVAHGVWLGYCQRKPPLAQPIAPQSARCVFDENHPGGCRFVWSTEANGVVMIDGDALSATAKTFSRTEEEKERHPFREEFSAFKDRRGRWYAVMFHAVSGMWAVWQADITPIYPRRQG